VQDETGAVEISFLDDLSWIASGANVTEIVETLEKCAKITTQWVEQNAVEFDIAKTEAILFVKKNQQRKRKKKINIGNGNSIFFNKGATRWLGFWMDSALNLNDRFTKRMAKARQREAEIKRRHGKYGMTPKNVRTIMTATVQTSALFGAEIWWRNQEQRAEQIQKMINREARAITGCMKTTPIGPLIVEASITPAKVLLDNRQRRYAECLAGLPKDQWAKQIIPNGILKHDGDPLDAAYDTPQNHSSKTELGKCLGNHLKQTINPKYGVERTTRTNPTTRGRVIIEGRSTAIEKASIASTRENNICTDGSRLESGNVGCAVAWRASPTEWKAHKMHLGNNKEIFDAKLFAIAEALKLANRQLIGNKQTNTIQIYTDSSAALQSMQDANPGPGKGITKIIVERERILEHAGWKIEYHWVLGHSQVKGNEVADKAAKDAARNVRTQGTIHLTRKERYTSLPYLHRKTKEKKWSDTKSWLKKSINNRPNYIPPTQQKPDPTAMATSKRLASRYYQLKMGHAITGEYLKRINSTNNHRCWWCNNGERQTLKHLIKDCHKWRKTRAKLKKEINTAIWNHKGTGHIFADRKNTLAILKVLEAIEIGNKTSEKEMAEKKESRDDVWGWQEEKENEEGEESVMEYEDREEALEVNDGENVEEDKTEGGMVEDEEARRKKLVEERCDKGSRDDHG
jgi:ribonuclease HI